MTEDYIWIVFQVTIVLIAICLWVCHFNERRKFRNQLVDFRDVNEINNYNLNQVEPLQAPLIDGVVQRRQ